VSSGEDRRITSSTIRGLASTQDELGRGVRSAVLSVQFAGDQVEKTHGLICAVTSEAIKKAEAERSTAGSGVVGVCAELAQKLRHAAARYDDVDETEKDKLEQQMPPR